MIVNAKRKIEGTTNNRSSRVVVCFFINWCWQQHFRLPQTSISWRLYRQKWRRCKWSVFLVNCSLRIASPLAISDDLLDTDWFVHDTFLVFFALFRPVGNARDWQTQEEEVSWSVLSLSRSASKFNENHTFFPYFDFRLCKLRTNNVDTLIFLKKII